MDERGARTPRTSGDAVPPHGDRVANIRLARLQDEVAEVPVVTRTEEVLGVLAAVLGEGGTLL